MGSQGSKITTSQIQDQCKKQDKKKVLLTGVEYFLSKETFTVTLSLHSGHSWVFDILKYPKHPKLNAYQVLNEVFTVVQKTSSKLKPKDLKKQKQEDFYFPEENEDVVVILESEFIKEPLLFKYLPPKKSLEDFCFFFNLSHQFTGDNIYKIEKNKLIINDEVNLICNFTIKMRLKEKKPKGFQHQDYKDKLKEKLELYLDMDIEEFQLSEVEDIIQLENNLDFKSEFFLKLNIKDEGLIKFSLYEPRTKSSKEFNVEILSLERMRDREKEILDEEKKKFVVMIKKSILNRFELKVKKFFEQRCKNIMIKDDFIKKVRELKDFQKVGTDEFICPIVKEMKEITSITKSRIYNQICDEGLESLKNNQEFMSILNEEISNQLSLAVNEKYLGEKKKALLEEGRKRYDMIRNLDIYNIDFDISNIYMFLYYEKDCIFLDYQNFYQFEIEVKLKHKALNKYLDDIPPGFKLILMLYNIQKNSKNEVLNSKILEIDSFEIKKDKCCISLSMERLNEVTNSIEKIKDSNIFYSFVFMIGETFKTTPIWTISEKNIEVIQPIKYKYHQILKYSGSQQIVHIMFRDSLLNYGVNPVNYSSFMIDNSWSLLQTIDKELLNFVDLTKELYFTSATKDLGLNFSFNGTYENVFMQDFEEDPKNPEEMINKYKKVESYDLFRFNLLTHLAARGKLEWVKKLIENGFVIDEKDSFGMNSIDWAFKMKEYKTVEYLLDVYYKDEIINMKEDVNIHLMLGNVLKNLEIDNNSSNMTFDESMRELSNIFNNIFRSVHSPKHIDDFEKLLEKGVEKEIPEAFFYLGNLYFYGTIKKQSLEDAKFYLDKAAETQEENALLSLSQFFGVKEATSKLLELFDKGELKNEGALTTVLIHFLREDLEKIFYFFEKFESQKWNLKSGDLYITFILVTSYIDYKLMKKYYREYNQKELVSRFSNKSLHQSTLTDQKSENILSSIDLDPYLRLLNKMQDEPSGKYFLACEVQKTDQEKAKEMFRESSKKGYKPANNKLALIYLKEMDSHKDKEKTLKEIIDLLKDSADLESRKILSILNYYGKDDGNGKVIFKRNQKKAIELMKEILVRGERESVYYLSMWIKESELCSILDGLVLKDVSDEVLNHILNIYIYLLDFKKVDIIYSQIQFFNLATVNIINEKKQVLKDFETIRDLLKDKDMSFFEELIHINNGSCGKVKYVKCKIDGQNEKEFAMKEIPIEYDKSFKTNEYMLNNPSFRDFSFLLKNGSLEIFHPNVIYIYHYFIDPKTKTLNIIMPYFVRSLYDIIEDRFTDISDKLLVTWISALSNVLLRLSIKKISHLDIKTQNIMLNSDLSIIYLIDFGEFIDCSESWVQIPSKKKLGTHGFRAPEIENIVKNQPVDFEKVDLFSMGIVFEKMKKKASPSLSKKIDTLVKKMKEIEPQRRINCYDLYLETEMIKRLYYK